MKKLFHVIFRLLLGISLIGLGIRTLTETSKLDSYVSQSFDQIQHRVLKKSFDITHFKQYSELIVFSEGYFFIAGGFLTIFGFCLSKLLIFIAVLIDLTLIHNVYFYRETKHLILASGFLGIFGGVLSI
jgi:hypothetical protein